MLKNPTRTAAAGGGRSSRLDPRALVGPLPSSHQRIPWKPEVVVSLSVCVFARSSFSLSLSPSLSLSLSLSLSHQVADAPDPCGNIVALSVAGTGVRNHQAVQQTVDLAGHGSVVYSSSLGRADLDSAATSVSGDL